MENLTKIKCDYDKVNRIYNCQFIGNEESKFSLKLENDDLTYTPSDSLSKILPKEFQSQLSEKTEEAQYFIILLIQGYFKVGVYEEEDEDISSSK